MAHKRQRSTRIQGRTRPLANIRETRKCFRIVCGGTETEPNYFKSFRKLGVNVKVDGYAVCPSQLVAKAKREKRAGDYSQVWCVFDRDSGTFTSEDFNEAIKNAEQAGIQIAYSNECFELWYVLHFCYHQTASSCQDYINILHRHLGCTYSKTSKKMYEYLEEHGYQADAIQHAEKLLAQYDASLPRDQANPSTTVHHLVRELIKMDE